MTRLRELIGAALRRRRLAQGRTLRQVAVKAGISLTYLSEVERGRKEPSSEVLVAVCDALGLVLSDVLFEVAEAAAREEAAARPAGAVGFLPPTRRLVPVTTAPRPASRPTVGHATVAHPTPAHPAVGPVVGPVVGRATARSAASPPPEAPTAPRALHVRGLHVLHRSA